MNQLKNNLYFRNISGQLTVGLAFAFAGILAMFALVFNSSLNTREKMKLQTTSDYASLVAANVQRYNLNFIRDTNRAIEDQWLITSGLLMPSYALTKSVAAYEGLILEDTATVTASLITNKTYTNCKDAAEGVDKHYRDKEMQSYKTIREQYASSILTSIEEANGLGFDQALYTFLEPSNLPQNLFMELESSLGNGFSVEDVRNEYEKGSLTSDQYAYEILSENKDDPLFIPKNESQPFIYPHYIYYAANSCYCSPDACQRCCYISPGFYPQFSSADMRITREGDYTTHFYTGIRYTPPTNLLEKMLTLGVKNPDNQNEKFGQNVEGIEGDLPLVSRKTKEIQAVSAAKPYGGTFPEAGMLDFVSNPLGMIKDIMSHNFSLSSSTGTSGAEFTGAKLFGIADTEEIGGLRNDRADACIDQMDDEGNIMGSVCYKAEDFLH